MSRASATIPATKRADKAHPQPIDQVLSGSGKRKGGGGGGQKGGEKDEQPQSYWFSVPAKYEAANQTPLQDTIAQCIG